MNATISNTQNPTNEVALDIRCYAMNLVKAKEFKVGDLTYNGLYMAKVKEVLSQSVKGAKWAGNLVSLSLSYHSGDKEVFIEHAKRVGLVVVGNPATVKKSAPSESFFQKALSK